MVTVCLSLFFLNLCFYCFVLDEYLGSFLFVYTCNLLFLLISFRSVLCIQGRLFLYVSHLWGILFSIDLCNPF